ncbi:MAG: hypothetical protein WA081_00020 [Desulfosalsimonadaceae bacterium]
MHIFADGLSKVTLSNLNLRITLVQNGPDNKQMEAGTLIIPATMANALVNGLANSLKKLDEQIKAQVEAKKNATESAQADIQ